MDFFMILNKTQHIRIYITFESRDTYSLSLSEQVKYTVNLPFYTANIWLLFKQPAAQNYYFLLPIGKFTLRALDTFCILLQAVQEKMGVSS